VCKTHFENYVFAPILENPRPKLGSTDDRVCSLQFKSFPGIGGSQFDAREPSDQRYPSENNSWSAMAPVTGGPHRPGPARMLLGPPCRSATGVVSWVKESPALAPPSNAAARRRLPLARVDGAATTPGPGSAPLGARAHGGFSQGKPEQGRSEAHSCAK